MPDEQSCDIAFISPDEPGTDLVRELRERAGHFEVIPRPSSVDSLERVLGSREYGLIIIDDRATMSDSERLLESLSTASPESAICMLADDIDQLAEAPRMRLLAKGAMQLISESDLTDRQSLNRLVAKAVGFTRRIGEFSRYRKMIEHTQDIITVLGENGEIVFESPSVRDVLGYDPVELVGQDPFALIHEEDRANVYEAYLEERQNPGATRNVEYRFLHADGGWRTLESTAKVLRNSDGSTGLIISSRDISKRRETLDELKNRESQLAEAQRLTHIGSWQWNVRTNELIWSDEMYRIYGFEVGSPLSLERFLEHIHPADRNQVRATIKGAQDHHESFMMTHRIVRPDGEVRVLEGRGEVRVDENDELLELYGTGHDITEIHESRTAIEESERRFRLLFESSPDAVIVFGPDSVIRDANPATARLLESDEDWLVGKTYAELCPPEHRDEAHNEFGNILDGELTVTSRSVLSRDGERIPVEMHANSLTLNEETAVLVYMRDISERLQTEQILRQLGRRQEEVLERERERISREVHDVLGQALTALRMDASWVASHLEHDGIPDRLEQMGERINETIETVRRIAHDLRPGVLDDFGLAAAIEWHADRFADAMDITVRAGTLDNPDIPRDLATTIFRVYQELLTNVARHADASEVEISLTAPADNLVLSVRDDGKGMDLDLVENSESLGLLGIRERLGPWDGRLDLESHPGEGTRADILVPISATDNAGTP